MRRSILLWLGLTCCTPLIPAQAPMTTSSAEAPVRLRDGAAPVAYAQLQYDAGDVATPR